MARAKKRILWSPATVAELKRLARSGERAKMIGRKLGRTESAIRQKTYSLGISLRSAQNRARRRAKVAAE